MYIDFHNNVDWGNKRKRKDHHRPFAPYHISKTLHHQRQIQRPYTLPLPIPHQEVTQQCQHPTSNTRHSSRPMPLQRRRPTRRTPPTCNFLRKLLHHTSIIRILLQRTLDQILHVHAILRRRAPGRGTHTRDGEYGRSLGVEFREALVCNIRAAAGRVGGVRCMRGRFVGRVEGWFVE